MITNSHALGVKIDHPQPTTIYKKILKMERNRNIQPTENVYSSNRTILVQVNLLDLMRKISESNQTGISGGMKRWLRNATIIAAATSESFSFNIV